MRPPAARTRNAGARGWAVVAMVAECPLEALIDGSRVWGAGPRALLDSIATLILSQTSRKRSLMTVPRLAPHGYGTEQAAVLAPLSDQATVESEAQTWAKEWAVQAEYRQPNFGDALQLPGLVVDTVRDVAMTFPAGTGLGCDNISPRSVARLSDAAIIALIRILAACENLGSWGSAFVVLIVMLAKPDGGLRPIGLFPALVRIWMRARITISRAWEAANAMPCLFGGAGMGAQRAAWVAAFRAEAAAVSGLEYAAGLLDLVKAFERVPHHLLARAAQQRGYDISVLRLSLAAYRVARSVGIDGVYSVLLVATRGITAGSGFATTELRLLLIGVVETVCRWWPHAQITLYVDDLTIAAWGRLSVAASTVTHAVDFVVSYFEQHLELEVSAAKSVIVGSRVAVVKAVIRNARTQKLKPVRVTKLLGAAMGGGRKRSVLPLRVRMHAFRKRLVRLHAFRRAGGSAATYVRTAALPSTFYGADVCGVADSSLNAARSLVARAVSPPAEGRNPDLVSHLVDAAGGGATDPAIVAHLMPLGQWAHAWWEGWASPCVLTDVFEYARTRQSEATCTWARVAGPAAATLATLGRLAWTAVSASVLQDDRGVIWDLVRDSPAVVKAAVSRSTARWRFRRVCKQFPMIVPSTPDCAPLEEAAGQQVGRMEIVDVSAVLRGLMSGRPTAVEGVPCWDISCRCWLSSAISGGQWPQARRATVAAWEADPRCQLCVSAPGTLEHRRICTATTPAHGWTQADSRLSAFTGGLDPARRRMLQTRALLAISIPMQPVLQEPLFRWLSTEPDVTSAEYTWYTDAPSSTHIRRSA
jgi:hypothetical protein